MPNFNLSLKLKKEEEAAEAMKEMERALESKLLEQECLMAKGFQSKAETLREEIQNLRDDMEIAKERDKAAQREALMSMTREISNGIQSYMEYKCIRENRKMLAQQNRERKYRLQQARGGPGQDGQPDHGSRTSLGQDGRLQQGIPGQGSPVLHQPKPGQTPESSSEGSAGTQASSSESRVSPEKTENPQHEGSAV